MVLGAVLLSEDATSLQLVGVALILTGLVAVASTRTRPVVVTRPGDLQP